MKSLRARILMAVLLLIISSLASISESCSSNKIEITCLDITTIDTVLPYPLRCIAGRPFISTVPDLSVASVVHSNGSAVSNLKQIGSLSIFNAPGLKFLPSGIKKTFTNLHELSVISCGLLSVHKKDLKEFGKALEKIAFETNMIIAIDAELFEYNTNLKWISLTGNPIRHIDNGFFLNLKHLKSIELVALRSLSCIDQEFRASRGDNIMHFEWHNGVCFDGTAVGDTQCLQCLSDKELCLNSRISSSASDVINNNWEIATILGARFNHLDVSMEKLIERNKALETKAVKLNNRIESLEKTNQKLIDENKKMTQKFKCRIDSMEEKLDHVIRLINQMNSSQ